MRKAKGTPVGQAEKLERLLALMTAPTTKERRAALSHLGVTIRRSVATDNSGTSKEYLVRGKVQVRVFEPFSVDEQPSVGGPSTVEESIAATSLDDCYPDTCATEEDLEAVDAMAAWLHSETDAGWESYNTTSAEIDEYCSENPWDCHLLPNDALQEHSGPSAESAEPPEFGPCTAYAGAAVAALFASAGIEAAWWVQRYNLEVALGVTDALGWWVALGAAGFVVGYAGAAYVDCKWVRVRLVELLAGAEFELGWSRKFEPVN